MTELLREMYRDHEGLVEGAGARLLPAVRRRRRRVVRNRIGYSVATLAVLAALGGVGVVTHGSMLAQPPAGPGIAASGIDPPAGFKWVSSLGVQFAVPADWAFNDFDRCGTHDGRPTVVRDPGPDVPFSGPPDVQKCSGDRDLLGTKEFAWITPAYGPSPTDWGLGGATGPVQPLTVTSPETTMSGSVYPVAHHQYQGKITLDLDGMELTVRADSMATVLTILRTLRDAPVDFAGCPVEPLDGRPDRSPLPSFVDPTPVSVAACFYDGISAGDQLEASALFTGADATSVATALNATAVSADPAPGRCSWTTATVMDGLLLITGSDRSVQAVYVEFSLCGPRWLDNGQTYRLFDHAIAMRLFGDMGVDWVIAP
jgi:hypothetical protein